MASLVRRILDRTASSAPAVPPLPRRGDHVEAWLKKQRDEFERGDSVWPILDYVVDQYRLHADTRTPLDQHCCEGGNVDDCADCYDAKEDSRG